MSAYTVSQLAHNAGVSVHIVRAASAWMPWCGRAGRSMQRMATRPSRSLPYCAS